MIDESVAKVIELQPKLFRDADQRRAVRRVDCARRHPSSLPEPGAPASVEQFAAVVGHIGSRPPPTHPEVDDTPAHHERC